MSVSIPANAPRGSTFKVAFFRWSGTRCDGTKVDTRSGLGDRGWSAGALDENQVELGTVGTVTVAPVPDAAGPAHHRLGSDAQQRAHRVRGQRPRRLRLHRQLQRAPAPPPVQRHLDQVGRGGQGQPPRGGDPVDGGVGPAAQHPLPGAGLAPGPDVVRWAGLLRPERAGRGVRHAHGAGPGPADGPAGAAGLLQPGRGALERAGPRGRRPHRALHH